MMDGLYKEGLHRKQQLLLPPSLDDCVNEENAVRAIDAYVELLDVINLGFSNTRKSDRSDGQKAYHPKLLLKIYNAKMKTEVSKAIIKRRGAIVEHPFGTIKRMLGWDHFLVRGKEKVSGENALIMFTYNFRRLLNLIGIALFQKLIVALKEGNIEAIKAEIALYIACFLGNMRLFFSKLLYETKSTWFRVEYL